MRSYVMLNGVKIIATDEKIEIQFKWKDELTN